MEHDPSDWELETRAIRTGHRRTPEGEHAPPLFLTSSFVFASAAEAAARFSGATGGNIYSRFTNPTVRAFEERLASLEGAESCVATASGMAAILATCLGLLSAGDHVVCSRSVFGSTVILFDKYLKKFGIGVSYVDLADMDAWAAAIGPTTRLLFLESPSNPAMLVTDIRASLRNAINVYEERLYNVSVSFVSVEDSAPHSLGLAVRVTGNYKEGNEEKKFDASFVLG